MYNMTKKEVKRIVDQEGLANTIENIIKWDDIKDQDLKFVWADVQIKLDKIKELLKEV